MIYLVVYLIIGMIVSAAVVIDAGQSVAKKNKYSIVAVFIWCIIIAVILSTIWPVLLGFAYGAKKKR